MKLIFLDKVASMTTRSPIYLKISINIHQSILLQIILIINKIIQDTFTCQMKNTKIF